jgi:hypothetical protein
MFEAAELMRLSGRQMLPVIAARGAVSYFTDIIIFLNPLFPHPFSLSQMREQKMSDSDDEKAAKGKKGIRGS